MKRLLKNEMLVGFLGAVLGLVILMLLYNLICCNLQRVEGDELWHEYPSPDGAYTLELYRVGGNHFLSAVPACYGVVRNNESGKTRGIYYSYPGRCGRVFWIDDGTVSIDEITLNIHWDSYDDRRFIFPWKYSRDPHPN